VRGALVAIAHAVATSIGLSGDRVKATRSGLLTPAAAPDGRCWRRAVRDP
jgi:hypothetical protein